MLQPHIIELERRMLLLEDVVGAASSCGLDSNIIALHTRSSITECTEHDNVTHRSRDLLLSTGISS